LLAHLARYDKKKNGTIHKIQMKISGKIMDREHGSDEKDRLIYVTELGHYIKRKRETERLSRRAVARQTQVSASTIARIEAGKGIPDTPTLARIARWLNIPFERVVTGGDSMQAARFFIPRESVSDIVAAHLRADRNLTLQQARALEDMCRIAYDQLVSKADESRPSVASNESISSAAKYMTFEIECEDMLTPSFLLATLGPFLQAIADIQYSIDEIQRNKRSKVLIKSITQQSPISITLEGAAKAVEIVGNLVIPFRRKHQQQLALLQEQEKKVEIGNRKAEILEKRAKAAKDRAEATKVAAEAAKQHAETERALLENEKVRIELHRAKIQLALEILSQVAPSLTETEKIAYVIKLLPPLEVLVSSELELRIGK